MTTYIKFKLTPGQMAPPGSTGVTVSGTDWLIWTGEDEKYFNSYATHGELRGDEVTPETYIEYELMSEAEIEAHIAYMSAPDQGEPI